MDLTGAEYATIEALQAAGHDDATPMVRSIRTAVLNDLFERLYDRRGQHSGSAALVYALETVREMLDDNESARRTPDVHTTG